MLSVSGRIALRFTPWLYGMFALGWVRDFEVDTDNTGSTSYRFDGSREEFGLGVSIVRTRHHDASIELVVSRSGLEVDLPMGINFDVYSIGAGVAYRWH
jgi:hypothetical protein